MSVRKRHDKWWVDFRFNGIRYRKPSPDNTRAGAQAYEIHLRYKLARGEPLTAEEDKKTSFKEFTENWFETYVKNNNKHSEVISKESILRVHLLPYFGRLPLEKIGSLDIEKYKARKLKEGLSAKTINNHLSVIRTSFSCAVEWGIISTCPIAKMLKTPPLKYDILSSEECWLLIRSTEGVWRDMIITALGTGMRFGELIALSWQDIDFERRELTVRQAFARGVLGSPKSNKTRLIPMNNVVFEVLRNAKKKAPFVFVDSAGKLLRQIASLKKLHRICRKAGLRKIGWHCLRHTFASHLVQAGANIVAVQNLLGHADIRTTMRYTHINTATLREAVSILDGNEVTENFGHNMVTIPTSPEKSYVIAKNNIPTFGSTKGKESLRSLLPA